MRYQIVGCYGVEYPFFFKELESIGVQYFRPFVAVISGGIPSLKNMREGGAHAIFRLVVCELKRLNHLNFMIFYGSNALAFAVVPSEVEYPIADLPQGLKALLKLAQAFYFFNKMGG